jgi:Protein of unknown function (DUF2599)
MLSKSHSITKILSIIFAFSLISSNLITNAQTKNSIEDIKKVQKNIREKDPQKVVSQELTQKSKNTLSSPQDNLEIEIDQVNKKVKINNQNKGDTTIGIPNIDQLNDGINVDNQVVFGSKNNKFDVFIEALDGGMRQVINIKDNTAPTTYDFPVELNTNEKLVVNEDGSASVITPDSQEDKIKKIEINQKNPELKLKSGKSKILIAKPWAKDANNKELSTSYSIINGNTLRQTIDTKNAVFPVVADPIWCGNAVASTSWLWRNNVVSASIVPTNCGAWGGQAWYSWEEAYSKIDNRYWDRNTNYWSMYNQYACHVDFAKGYKPQWNIEPSKADKGYWGFANFWDQCN